MSRLLFIRVSAETYDEKELPKTWPMLYAAVWPDPGVDGMDSPAKLARKLVPAPGRGVLALLDGLVEHVRFGDLSGERREALEPFADTLDALRGKLDAALGDRDVAKAHELTNAIEDALDNAEKVAGGS